MANFGTMTKPFHAGRAAHAGLVSARLAELGFTAAADALEHPQGFCRRYRPRGASTAKARPVLGEEWQIVKQGLSIKKYPACYCTHRALDAMLDLLAKRPLKPAEIKSITVSISKTHSADPAQPHAADRARSEIQHGVRDGGCGDLAPRQPRRIHRCLCPPSRGAGADAQVSIVTNENYDPQVSGASAWDQVVVELANGERIESEQVRRARGHAELPLGEAELFDKFRTCLDAGGARISPERLFERLRNLENISARELTAIG